MMKPVRGYRVTLGKTSLLRARLNFCQCAMHEMNADRAFSHRRRNSLYVSSPYVAHRKHSREARFQHFGRTIERPPRVASAGASRIDVAACQNEALLIEGYAALQPFCSRRSARHDEHVADGMFRLGAGRSVAPGNALQVLCSAESANFGLIMEVHLPVLLEPLNEVPRHRAGESLCSHQH